MFIAFKKINPAQTLYDDELDEQEGPSSSWKIVDKKERRQNAFRDRLNKLKANESEIL